jgi:hypothetical protein
MNFENDTAKGFESFVSSDLEVHRKPVAMHTYRRQKSEPCTIQQLLGAPENPGHMPYVMSLVSIDQTLQIWESNLAI